MASQKEIAEHLDLSGRQVLRLLKAGVLPTAKGQGGYPVDDCRRAYIRYLRGLHRKQVQEPGGLDRAISPIDQARIRELQERADNISLKNAQLRRELAPLPVITYVLNKIAAQIGPLLDSIPAKVKARLPRITAAELEIIKREIIKSQNAAARVSVELDEYLSDHADREP